MISSGSLLVICSMSLLLAGSPGTMANSPDLAGLRASSLRSNRRRALRSFSSGPWHLKQFSEKIGRMSRLKSITGPEAALTELPVANALINHRTAKVLRTRNLLVLLEPMPQQTGISSLQVQAIIKQN